MKYRLVLLVCLNLLVFLCHAQKFTVSGYIRDATNGESLIGANVYTEAESLVGVTANLYGYYSLQLEPGNYTLKSSYIGYNTVEVPIQLQRDTAINFDIYPNSAALEEVVVVGERKDKNVESTDMGKVELSIEKIQSIPAFLGEVDIVKAIQLLPGVQAAGEGNSGFYVRGGGADQNLVLLDDAIVYNTGHLFGFFSVFNADAVKNTTLIKGGMPAEYGGRLASVLDVSMKDGNNKRFQMNGGIGLISSRLTLQAPIVKNKSSFLISARRTYAFDLAQPYLKKTDFAGTNYHFYDLNLKANYRFSDKDRLYLSGYFGRDVFVYSSVPRDTKVRIPWGNATSTLRWNHVFNDKFFMNTSFIFNNYKFEFEGSQDDFRFKLFSGIRDFNLKFDIDYFQSARNKIKFGYNYTFHTFTPNSASGSSGDTEFATTIKKRHGHEMGWYFQDEWTATDWLKINAGFRLSMYQHTGPFEEVRNQGARSDTTTYKTLEAIQTYFGAEPRLSMRFAINKSTSLKAGFAMNSQYVHLVSSSNSTLPTDVWVPSSKVIKPQRSIQYSLGFFKNFKADEYETSVEVYYKDLWNQIEFGESYVQEINTEIEEGYVFGDGRAYGVEFFVKKRVGKINGWLGYTLSKSEREFDNLNAGNIFPAKFDRTHDVSFNLTYDISKAVSLGATWVYATGNAFTLPIERYFVDLNVVTGYGERNGFRLPAYHRMDLGLTISPNRKPDRRFKSFYNFSIYNVYNRKNTYFIYYDIVGDPVLGDVEVNAVKVSIFPIIPSFTWNFKF